MAREFLSIRTNPLGFLQRAWQRYGDVVQFPIPSPPSYLVNDPAAVRRVLVEVPREYSKSTIQYRSLAAVTGNGLLVADHDRWREQRQLVQPAFHPGTLERVHDISEEIADRVAAQWSRPAVVDMDSAMMEAALEVVGHALFGADLSASASELTSATLAALDVVVGRARTPITPPSWVPTPGNRKLARSLNTLNAAVDQIIAERSSVDAGSADMLDLLLAGLDRESVRDEVVTFIVAGHETVASALTWTWALLAAHPEVQRQLHDELDSVLGGRAPSMEDVLALPYTRAVFDEALRLYPPAWLITRTALNDDELGGRDIPAGALIIMSPYLLHRHPDVWSDPESFNPTRTFDRNAFIPFGNGPRLCIGRDFAYIEAITLLAVLAQRGFVSYPGSGATKERGSEGVPAYTPLVTMRPANGLHLRVTPRSVSQ